MLIATVNDARSSSPVVAPGDTIAGGYRLEEEIGRGSMGTVFSAVSTVDGQRVAIKVLHPRHLREPEHMQRFVREAKVASRLESPHAVRVRDVGCLDGEEAVPFFVMDLLEGIDLRQHVRRHGPTDIGRAVDWLLQACHAVEEAHAQGVVHRDLKPANLFLATDADGAQRIKVIDFGVSKLLRPIEGEGDVTATTVVVGTPAFMAPEQMRSSDVDHRADVWALGATLYFLLAGRRPFAGDSIVKIYESILRGPKGLRAQRPDVPVALEACVMETLTWEPDERVSTVRELVARLRHIHHDAVPASEATQVLVTGPEPPPVEAAPPSKRRRVPLAWSGALVGAVALAGVSYGVGTRRSETSTTHAFSPSQVRLSQIRAATAAVRVDGPAPPILPTTSAQTHVAQPKFRLPKPSSKPSLAPPKRRGKGDAVWGMP